MSERLVLIGFKACGKTSVGQRLALLTQQAFVDTDDLIERQYHLDTGQPLSCSTIYQTRGAHFFRQLEKNIISTTGSLSHPILATGGGSILDPGNVACLKQQGKLIYLYITYETLLSRLCEQPRPAFLEDGPFETHVMTLYEQREKLYKNAADVEIDTEGQSVSAIAEIIRSL